MNQISPKISIITITYNSIKTLRETLDSVKNQTYSNIEHIIIDGKSTDGSVDLCKKYKHIDLLISEHDLGIYDALNKGIEKSTGDIIGILHSDDVFYSNDILKKIAFFFDTNKHTKIFLGDIIQIKKINTFKIKRLYQSKLWSPKMFAWGRMPAHPAFFCRREVFVTAGLYKLNYKIAADFEFLIRILLKKKYSYQYIPMITTEMKVGGASTKNIASLIRLNKEIMTACYENGLYTNYLMIYSKYFLKIFEFFPFSLSKNYK
jgi:glycosyltransferase involved in cell wall biosynthesis